MTEQQIFFLFPGIFLLVGVVFTAVGFGLGRSYRKKQTDCTAQTIGKVIDNQRRTERDMDGYSTVSYYPVFSYYANGTQYQKCSSIGRSRPRFKPGQSVYVFYNPSNPDRWYVPADHPYALIQIFSFVGLALLLVGIVSLILCLRYLN